MNERECAEMEAARNAAEDAYFYERPLLFRSMAVENVYRAGFESAWKRLSQPTKFSSGGGQVLHPEYFTCPAKLVVFFPTPESMVGALRGLALQVESGNIISQQIDMNSTVSFGGAQTTTLVLQYVRKQSHD